MTQYKIQKQKKKNHSCVPSSKRLQKQALEKLPKFSLDCFFIRYPRIPAEAGNPQNSHSHNTYGASHVYLL